MSNAQAVLHQIIQTLQAAERAHRKSVGTARAHDPGWAGWYAHYLLEHTSFSHYVERQWTAADLTTALEDLDTAYAHLQPKAHWTQYFAQRLSQ